MSLKLWVIHLISRKQQSINKSEDCLNNDEEYDEIFIYNRIRMMCSNWFYVNNREEARKMNLQTYRKKQSEIFSMLRSSPYLHDVIFPMFDEVKTSKEFYDSNMFEKVQTQVFKFLNILNKKVDLEKDFL